MADRGLEQIRRGVLRCRRCPRLVEYLAECRAGHPEYWARPVPGFGDPRARIAVVGLAPGYHGANRSGRPFWLDASGEWLYGELERRGLWDGETLSGVHILNAVKCVPPQNRPTGAEQAGCLDWLRQELAALEDVRLVLALGSIAHRAVLKAWDASPLVRYAFSHGSLHRIERRPPLLSSYHPSRQNTNTGVLTRRMWRSVFARAVELAAV